MPTLSARFSSPSTLRSIRPDLLVEWLRPSAGYLEDRGFRLPEMKSHLTPAAGMQNGEGRVASVEREARSVERAQRNARLGTESVPRIDYDRLADIFMNPTAGMPLELLESVFLIQEMANPPGMDLLLAGAEAHGIDVGHREDLSPADVAVQFWLMNPRLLENLHNCQEITRPRSFRYFSTDANPVPAFSGPTEKQIAALEERLNGFYVAWKRGKGARVFSYPHEHEWWFLVRHGAPCRREAAMQDGEPTSVCYRPQKHDVLKYDTVRGEIAINCCCDRERRVLLRAFGTSVFGRCDFFPGTAKYSLAPLVQGRTCLACADLFGIERVGLIEVEFFFREEPWKCVRHKAGDIFELAERGELEWPRKIEEITRATFKVKFRRARRARRLTIVPCNKALYARDSDSGVLEKFLKARGFVLDCAEDEALTDTKQFEPLTKCKLEAA